MSELRKSAVEFLKDSFVYTNWKFPGTVFFEKLTKIVECAYAYDASCQNNSYKEKYEIYAGEKEQVLQLISEAQKEFVALVAGESEETKNLKALLEVKPIKSCNSRITITEGNLFDLLANRMFIGISSPHAHAVVKKGSDEVKFIGKQYEAMISGEKVEHEIVR